MKKTVIELFAGVGGFRVGLNHIKKFNLETQKAVEEGEWDFVWANQWEPSTKVQHAYDCYATRFGASDVSNVDISLVNKTMIPNHNLLVGGFPCQDYSVARSKSNEKGIEGKKGVLFWDIAATLEAKRTPFFLLENVDRLLKSPARQRGRDFGIMIRTLSDLGYDLEWRVINAAEYGRAQRRRRVLIFGWRRDLNYSSKIGAHDALHVLTHFGLFAKSFPIDISTIGKSKSKDVNVFLDTVEMTTSFSFGFENTGVSLNGILTTAKTTPLFEEPMTLNDIYDYTTDTTSLHLNSTQLEKFKFLRGSKKIERRKPNGDPYFYSEGSMSFPDSLDLPGRTMLTSESSINRSTHVIEDKKTGKLRFITPIEAERMQDFPDNWTNTGMPSKRRYFMMGNALVTGLIGKVESHLSSIFENED